MNLAEQTGTTKDLSRSRAILQIRPSTKARLEASRLPGQSYDGFIQMLISNWDRQNRASTDKAQLTPA